MNYQRQEWRRKARAEGAIEALEHIKTALCQRELNASGREHVNKMLVTYKKQVG